jgi:hypothetical protein
VILINHACASIAGIIFTEVKIKRTPLTQTIAFDRVKAVAYDVGLPLG